jgi:hypothetical protein
MARVFISHSSRDTEQAAHLFAHLKQHGFQEAFLDFDKHAGIPPGANWERTLYTEIERADAIVLLLTLNWFASKWCFAEFTQSRALGKEVFPLIAAPIGDLKASPDIQHLTLIHDADENLERLIEQLTRISQDSRAGFIWNRRRVPYPGLLAFQEEDAAVFFGRQVEVRRLIQRLNARKLYGDRKLIALLGASGSGKSSLLRAGVIPRLKRDSLSWITLPPIRPQRDPTEELARAIGTFLGRPYCQSALKAECVTSPSAVGSNLANEIRSRARSPDSEILISIDQGEELFTLADKSSADAFMALLNILLQPHLPFSAIVAMRSDALQLLQEAPIEFEEFSLRPVQPAVIRDIIVGPARVTGLGIDNAMVDAVVRDATTEDLLPLLAFTLRELYERFAKEGKLTLAQYVSLGDTEYQNRGPGSGLNPIENTIRQKADELVAVNRFADGELSILRASFVSTLTGINEEGQFVRRPAKWNELSNEAQRILGVFINERLLVTYADGEDQYVEVVHEALLRKWPTLTRWLEDERDFLDWLRRVRQDRRLWELATPDDKGKYLLTGRGIEEAKKWSATKGELMPHREQGFIGASLARAGYRETVVSSILSASALYLIVAYPVAFFANAIWFGLESGSRALGVPDESSVLVGLAKLGILLLALALEITINGAYLWITLKYGFRIFGAVFLYLVAEFRSTAFSLNWLYRQYMDRIGSLRERGHGHTRSIGGYLMSWAPLSFGIASGIVILYKIWTPLIPRIYKIGTYLPFQLPFEPTAILFLFLVPTLLGALRANLLFDHILRVFGERDLQFVRHEPYLVDPPVSTRVYYYFIYGLPLILCISFLHAWLSALGSVTLVNPLSVFLVD